MSSSMFYSQIPQQRVDRVVSPIFNSPSKPKTNNRNRIISPLVSKHKTQYPKASKSLNADQAMISASQYRSKNEVMSLAVKRKPIFPKGHRQKKIMERNSRFQTEFSHSLQAIDYRRESSLNNAEERSSPEKAQMRRSIFQQAFQAGRNDDITYANFIVYNQERESIPHNKINTNYFQSNRLEDSEEKGFKPSPPHRGRIPYTQITKAIPHRNVHFTYSPHSQHQQTEYQSPQRSLSPQHQNPTQLTQPKLQSHQLPFIVGDNGPLYDKDALVRTPTPISKLYHFPTSSSQLKSHKESSHSEVIAQMRKIIKNLQGKMTGVDRLQLQNEKLRERNKILQREIQFVVQGRQSTKIAGSRFGQYLKRSREVNQKKHTQQDSTDNSQETYRYFLRKIINYKQKMDAARQIIQQIVEKSPQQKQKLVSVLQLLDISQKMPQA